MKILLFGSTGMLGQGVLRECLIAQDVELVTAMGRTPSKVSHPKLRQIVHRDLFHYADIEDQLSQFDACFFCVGMSSAGMHEEEYKRLTYDLTIAAADTLSRIQPAMTFIYISGAGTDSSEQGRTMWARIKGKTENSLTRFPFRAVYLLRPGIIQPMHGARSKTFSYRILYALAKPVLPVLRRAFPRYILTTEQIGLAMLELARHGASKSILGSQDMYGIVNR